MFYGGGEVAVIFVDVSVVSGDESLQEPLQLWDSMGISFV